MGEVRRHAHDLRPLRRRLRAGAAPERPLGDPGDLARGRLHLREARGVLEDRHAVAEDRLVVHARRLVRPHVEVLNRGDDDGARLRKQKICFEDERRAAGVLAQELGEVERGVPGPAEVELEEEVGRVERREPPQQRVAAVGGRHDVVVVVVVAEPRAELAHARAGGGDRRDRRARLLLRRRRRRPRHDEQRAAEHRRDLDPRGLAPGEVGERDVQRAGLEAGAVEERAQLRGLAAVEPGDLDRREARAPQRRERARQIARARLAEAVELDGDTRHGRHAATTRAPAAPARPF